MTLAENIEQLKLALNIAKSNNLSTKEIEAKISELERATYAPTDFDPNYLFTFNYPWQSFSKLTLKYAQSKPYIWAWTETGMGGEARQVLIDIVEKGKPYLMVDCEFCLGAISGPHRLAQNVICWSDVEVKDKDLPPYVNETQRKVWRIVTGQYGHSSTVLNIRVN